MVARDSNAVNNHTNLLQAEIIASFGRHYLAKDQKNVVWQVFAKGKKKEVAVGDKIDIIPSGDLQAWVHKIYPRNNLLYRSDNVRSKLFAANVDLVFLMIALSPPFSQELLGRTMVACSAAGIELHLLFNKTDLLESNTTKQQVQQSLEALTGPNFAIDWVSLKQHPEAAKSTLIPIVKNKTILVIGQSGMGKSTLINLLEPNAQVITNTISEALNTGKHTTTAIKMHYCNALNTKLIDSPGFQKFGLHHVNENNLFDAFPDIMQLAEHCRFDDCQHLNEPNCTVKNALKSGELQPARFDCFVSLRAEIQTSAKQW